MHAPARRNSPDGRRRGGFSLVELMVVLVILGILASVVGFNLVGAAEKARIQTTQTQMATCGGAIKLYKASYAVFPPEGEQGMQALVAENLVDVGAIKDAWGSPMYFTAASEVSAWEIWSDGPDREPSTEDDIVYRPDGQ